LADAGDESLLHLRACVDQLAGRLRDVVRWHYEERCSRRTIGERLGMGDDGVKSLLRRTRAALRSCVEQRRAEGA
jgi:DNA-directed RNA polymerase specialized sigma24 family protein